MLNRDRMSQQERDILDGKVEYGPAEDLRRNIDDIIHKRVQSLRIKHQVTINLTQALIPQTQTILCGTPGHGKSLWLQEVLMDLCFTGVPVAVLHLEESMVYHLRRCAAQISATADFTNYAWIEANAGRAMDIATATTERVNQFAKSITVCPEKRWTYAEVVKWIEDQAKARRRVIAVDPITLAKKAGPVWEADEDFICATEKLSQKFGISIILVTHPKQGQSQEDFINRMAGGASFSRAVQTILWLEYLAEPMPDAKITFNGMIIPVSEDRPINRVMHLNKTRNGTGIGSRIGYYFNVRTLCYEELGVMVQQKKRGRGYR